MNRVGIIGAGNIGSALAKGFVQNGKIDPPEILVSRKKNSMLSDLESAGFTVTDNAGVVKECEYVILSVLPGQAEEVVREIAPGMKEGNAILISVVAAVSIEEMDDKVRHGLGGGRR